LKFLVATMKTSAPKTKNMIMAKIIFLPIFFSQSHIMWLLL
jgi:hypothetical protein